MSFVATASNLLLATKLEPADIAARPFNFFEGLEIVDPLHIDLREQLPARRRLRIEERSIIRMIQLMGKVKEGWKVLSCP
jgi:hypothetical protein